MPKTILYALGAFVLYKVFSGGESSSTSSTQAAADAAAHQRALDEAAAKAAAGASQNNTVVADVTAIAGVGVSLINAFSNAFAQVSAKAEKGQATETRVNPDDPGWG